MVSVPVCIPKLKGHEIITDNTSKQTVRGSILKYSRYAANWVDAAVPHKTTTKYATYSDIDIEYHPHGIIFFSADAIHETGSIQPTFELDTDSPTFVFTQKFIQTLRSNSLLTLENSHKRKRKIFRSLLPHSS